MAIPKDYRNIGRYGSSHSRRMWKTSWSFEIITFSVWMMFSALIRTWFLVGPCRVYCIRKYFFKFCLNTYGHKRIFCMPAIMSVLVVFHLGHAIFRALEMLHWRMAEDTGATIPGRFTLRLWFQTCLCSTPMAEDYIISIWIVIWCFFFFGGGGRKFHNDVTLSCWCYLSPLNPLNVMYTVPQRKLERVAS